ncbi:MAG: hypothetical protein NZM37_06420 [Sandaracinaceae bacterium]|nr:hypothetical protein [Sandaracinaceae bacterium]MDW8246618.1 hypothetical protein [Sandaracinaceae bacterium]
MGRQIALLFLALVALLWSCLVPGTGGRLVQVRLALQPRAREGQVLGRSQSIDPEPWSIEILEAKLIIGALYLFPPRPLFSWQALRLLFWLPPKALAHAGDDNEGGNAILEHLDQVVVDLLDPTPIDLGARLGESAVVDRASLWLDHPRGDLARMGASGPTRGHLAWVHLRAKRGFTCLEIRTGIDIPPTPLRRRVDRIRPERPKSLEEGMEVTFYIYPSDWFSEVDFNSLIPSGNKGDQPIQLELNAPSQFHNAWQIAMSQPSSYGLELRSPMTSTP